MDIAGKVLGTAEKTNYFLENLKIESSPIFILDIIIVSVLFYWVYIFLRETRAMRILYGLIFLLLFMAIGKLFNLVLLNWILKSLMTMLIVAIPVVFQPELRTALEKLGRTKLLGELAFSKIENIEAVSEIIEAVTFFTAKKIGALIVIKRQIGLREYIDNGCRIDAKLSAKMLASIFFPKSPLHDGAAIISQNKIIAAGSILPVSQSELNESLGTRHKAGVGLSEVSDAIVVIVSEETGNISLAVGGRLETKLSAERLKNRLLYLMKQEKKK